MLFAKWFAILIKDIVMFGVVNKEYALGSIILLLLALGLLVVGVQFSAPFIYTLF